MSNTVPVNTGSKTKEEFENPLLVEQPYATNSYSSDSISLTWRTPRPLEENEAFCISYKEGNKGSWTTYDKPSQENMITISGLKSGSKYYFRVKRANHISGDEGPYSKISEAIMTDESPAFRMLQLSSKVPESDPPVYTLPIEEDINARNSTAKTRKFTLGESRHKKNPVEKTIMVVGATGSGKSTLLNAMANYIIGVKWEDLFRFTLVNLEQDEQQKHEDQAQSQTEWVTCYTIHQPACSSIDYTINLIDTPGFGDTRGLDHDEKIIDQIRELFTSKGPKGVDSLDAVCFIVKAPDSRLTITQRYIFESILALFGNDIKENICTLITFADGERPQVLAGIQALEGVPLPYKQYFTFNNSALFVGNSNIPKGSLSPIFWEMGMRSCDHFFTHIKTLKTKSLTLTTEVLNSRHTLQNKIHNLQTEVDKGMLKITTLEREIDIFTNYKDAIKDNADFEYEVEEEEQVKEDLSGTGQHTTTCLTCHFTCHENCQIASDSDKDGCIAMKNGKCTECPGLCPWNSHYNTPYIIKIISVKKMKRYAEKMRKYQEARQQSLTQEQVIDEMKQDIVGLDNTIEVLLEVITRLNNRLKEIALRADPMSTAEYIELMIDAEIKGNHKGFDLRVKALQRCKDRAKYGEKVQIFQDRLQQTQRVIPSDELDKASKDDGAIWKLLRKFNLRK